MAPSIAHAIAAAKGELWVEVCSVSGSKLVKVGGQAGEAPTDQQSGMTAMGHCTFCLTHIDPPVPVAEYAVSSLRVPVLSAHPALFYHSPRPLAVWASAQTRGPPRFS